MPRPKRTKIKTTYPHPDVYTSSANPITNAKSSAAQSAPDKTSSDSDGIVKNASGASRLGVDAVRNGLYAMSGGLGPGDVRGAHKEHHRDSTTIQSVKKEIRASKLPSKYKDSTVPRKSMVSPCSPFAEKKNAANIKMQKTTAAASKEASRLDAQASGIQGKTEAGSRLLASARSPSPDENIAPPPGSTVRDPSTNMVQRVTDSFPPAPPRAPSTAPRSVARSHGTPGFLSMANFKRRPRQGSLLQMVKANIASESGNERSEMGRDHEDEDSLLTLGDSPMPSEGEASSRKRKAPALEQEKRKLPRSLSVRASESAPRVPEKASRLSSKRLSNVLPDDTQMASSPPPDHQKPNKTPQYGKITEQRDPASSSSSSSSIQKYVLPPKRPRPRPSTKQPKPSTPLSSRQNPIPRRSKVPPPDPSPVNATSPLSTPPSSPPQRQQQNPPTTTATASSKARAGKSASASRSRAEDTTATRNRRITTAALQTLLPARRRRGLRERDGGHMRDELDIIGSGSEASEESESDGDEDEDEDELARPYARRRRKETTKQNHETWTLGWKAKGKGKGGVSGEQKGKPRGKQAPGRTYGRSTRGDEKENEGQDERTSERYEDDVAAANDTSREMREAARKFREVDEWDMEFESADIGAGGSSSPWR